MIEGTANLRLRAWASPRLDHGVVRPDQDRHRLVRDAIQGENLFPLVETPLDLARLEQLAGPDAGGFEVGFPGRGHEIDPVGIFSRKTVDDRQLLSAGWSPLGPEHQVDRLLSL